MGKRKCNKCRRHLNREVPYEGHKCPYRHCDCYGCHPKRKCKDLGPSGTKRDRPSNTSYQYQLSATARNQPLEQERNRESGISHMLIPLPFNSQQPSNDSSISDISAQRRLHVPENQRTLAQGLLENRKQELFQLVTNIRNEVQGGANADNKASAMLPPRLFPPNYGYNKSSNSSVSHRAIASKVQLERKQKPSFSILARNFKQPVQTSVSALKAVAGPSYMTQGTLSSGETEMGNLPNPPLNVKKKCTLSFLEAAEESTPETNSAKNPSLNDHFNRMQRFVPRNLFIKRVNQRCLFQNSMPAQQPKLFRVNCARPSNPKSNLEATSPQSTSISSSSPTVGNWPYIFHPSKDTRLLINTIDNDLKTVTMIQQPNSSLDIIDNSQSVKPNEPTTSPHLHSSMLISSPTDHSYVSVQRPNSQPFHLNNNPSCRPKVIIRANKSAMLLSKSESTSVPSTNVNYSRDQWRRIHKMPSLYSAFLSDPVYSISPSLSNRTPALEKNKTPTCQDHSLAADHLLPTSQDNTFIGDYTPVLERDKMPTCQDHSLAADHLLPTSQDNTFIGDYTPVLERDATPTCQDHSLAADHLLPTSQDNTFIGDYTPVLERDETPTCQDHSLAADHLLLTSQDNTFIGDYTPVLERDETPTCQDNSLGADHLLPTCQDNFLRSDQLLPTSQDNAFAGDYTPALKKDETPTCQDNSLGSDQPLPTFTNNNGSKPEESISEVSRVMLSADSNLFDALYLQWESCTQAFWETVDTQASEMGGLSVDLNSDVTEFCDEFDKKENTDDSDNPGLPIALSGDSFCDFENNHDNMAILATDDSRSRRKFHSSSCSNTEESQPIAPRFYQWIRLQSVTLQFKQARDDVALFAALFPGLPNMYYVLTYLSCGGKFFPALKELAELVKTKRPSPSLDRQLRALCRVYMRKDREYRKALK